MVQKQKNNQTQDCNITLVQSSLFWENPKQNLSMFQQKLSDIENTNLIVLPEMFTTGFSNNSIKLAETMNGPSISWMASLAEKTKACITGSLIIKDGDEYFNRAIWMRPDHSFESYDKKHLFAMAGEDQHYSSGSTKTIVELLGWKILIQICYDLRFPVWARRVENQDYDLILYMANWPTPRVDAWSALLRARAIENMAYVIGVNRVGMDDNGIEYSGHSEVFDPLGKSKLSFSPSEEGIQNITIDHQILQQIRTKLPFQKDACRFSIL